MVRSLAAYLSRNRRYVVSAASQLLLFPFGHWFDTRIFFGVGAGVAHGLSPYSAYDLGDYYNSPSLVGVVSGTGYPPPWSLFLAFLYIVVYAPTGNPLVMNFAMKLPIIAGNLLLSRFVKTTLAQEGCNPRTCSRAESLVLFNPFLIFTSAFWNMFDTLVSFLMLVSIQYLARDRPLGAGLSLGLSIALKHLALPLVPLGLLWFATRPMSGPNRFRQVSVFIVSLVLVIGGLVLAPFLIFGWPFSGFYAAISYQTVATGGLTIYGLLPIDLSSPSVLSILGYLPFITAGVMYLVFRRRPLNNFCDLIEFSVIILIAFMSTRTFLAEQNLAVIFPPILFPELIRGRGFQIANRFWILFLLYSLFNSIPIAFAFLVFPNAFDLTVAITTSYVFGGVRSWLLLGCSLLWLFLGWRYILRQR